MKRKVAIALSLVAVVLLVLFGAIFYLDLQGDIPDFMERDNIEYQKTLDIQSSFGRIWFTADPSRDPTYFYRLHLSQADFNATGILALRRAPNERESRIGPIWWIPPSDAQCFVGPGKILSSDLYFYDPRRELLWARCQM